MASLSFITFFIFSLLLTTTSSSTTQQTPQQLQFNSIIDSIVGAGDFTNWANLLSQADPSFFPLAATFFIPDDTALASRNLSSSSPSPSSSSSSSTVNFLDPLLFPYQIVPRRFDFIDLLQFPTGARLPTLLPGNTLLITNNSADNFTINGALITHPDLFQNALVSAHGVGRVLGDTLYGKDEYDYGDILSAPEMPPAQDSFVSPTPTEDNGPVISFAASKMIDTAFIVIFILVTMFLFWLTSVIPNHEAAAMILFSFGSFEQIVVSISILILCGCLILYNKVVNIKRRFFG